jgi:hypothetical protein
MHFCTTEPNDTEHDKPANMLQHNPHRPPIECIPFDHLNELGNGIRDVEPSWPNVAGYISST